MNVPYADLASRPESRRVKRQDSSASALGLDITKVLQGGLLSGSFGTEGKSVRTQSVEENIFNALADAKIWTSRVAMHMSREDRDRYFRQLDLLHDCDEWFGDEKPVKLGSYKSFVRFMLATRSPSKPALALAPSGHLVAVWLDGNDRLTVEFEPDDRAQWVANRKSPELTERAAGTTVIGRLVQVLAPYNPSGWLRV